MMIMDEEDHEALCCLLISVGKNIDNDKNVPVNHVLFPKHKYTQ